jgi:hypothetical protein
MSRLAALESEILRLLEGRCLNTAEICRALNHVPESKGRSFCRRSQARDYGRSRTGFNVCSAKGCRVKYSEVVKVLQRLWRRGYVRSIKTRFYDQGGNHTFDTFRFWFTDEAAYHRRVTLETLDKFGTMEVLVDEGHPVNARIRHYVEERGLMYNPLWFASLGEPLSIRGEHLRMVLGYPNVQAKVGGVVLLSAGRLAMAGFLREVIESAVERNILEKVVVGGREYYKLSDWLLEAAY